jgi:GLPGLI family protein
MKIQANMKRIIILLGVLTSLTAAHYVFAQTEGVITYEVKVDQHRRIPKEREAMKANIPQFRTFKQQLFFKESESLYKPLIEDEDEDTGSMNSGGGGRGGFRMMANNNSETYLNQNSSTVLVKQEFMGTEYLIEDSVKLSPWKFGTETKTILGYECKQAYYTDESMPNRPMEVTAWYTDKIRPLLGPERFNTLPGTVLALDINNGERVTRALKVDMRSLKKNEFKIPSGGQKVTQAEFRKQVEEQMKKMGGDGRVMIRN